LLVGALAVVGFYASSLPLFGFHANAPVLARADGGRRSYQALVYLLINCGALLRFSREELSTGP
jgi:hypothetical protein